MSEPLLRLPASSPEEVLGELARRAERARQGDVVELPTVTLWLSSGPSISGRLIAMDRGQLLLAGEDRPLEANYVPLEAVRAVTVHNTVATVHLLSQGRLDPDRGQPAPSRLEVKRRFQKDLPAQWEATVEWDHFLGDDDTNSALDRALQELLRVLREVGADPQGQEAVRAGVQRIEVRPSAEDPRLLLKGGTLTVLLGVQEGQLRRLPMPDLKTQLEKLL